MHLACRNTALVLALRTDLAAKNQNGRWLLSDLFRKSGSSLGHGILEAVREAKPSQGKPR